ncbi:hypothetical protein PVAND_007000 [Polypedilum vanderplanki]|uniref:Uncharacterized protein n=1 Tax=Polypedilum vanderplanki TaxID=319348 RepID=A0A9J6C5W3_POLVA|nr:hypothetical protein PVAND_007000 [Polypedilum vanderplanki]
MRPLEKFETNCTVLLVTSEQQEKNKQQPDQQQKQEQQQQQCDISLSAFSDIYNEYLSDHSEIETASTSDTDSSSSSTSTSISNQTNNKENYERVTSSGLKQPPDIIRSNLHTNQLFGVQLEVNFLLLEAERRKLKILQQELNLSLDECDKFERKKRNKSQCHELLLTISRIQSQHNLLEKELTEHTIDILKYSNIKIVEKIKNTETMLNANQNQTPPPLPAKPPIPAKPKNVQKTNYVVIPQTDHSTSSGNNNHHHIHSAPRAIPTPTRNVTRNANAEQQFTVGSANHFSSSTSSSPLHHYQQHRTVEFTNDFLNKQQQMEINMQRHNNNHNGTHFNGASEQNDYGRHKNVNEIVDKSFHTPSHSFDSSSSSSGGFRELDFIAKTKAVYEMFEKSERNDFEATSVPYVGHSKVQEIQSRLLAQQQQLQLQQQQQQQNNHNELTRAINREQIQKSSKELEKLLGMRVEKKMPIVPNNNQEKPVRRLSKSFDEVDDSGIANLTNKLALNISKQIQQKLQQEMKQQCEIIKEKYLIEKVEVQQHYKDYVNNRNQPAIGLKQNSKTRVFET